MASMFRTSFIHIICLILFTLCSSQNTICVWNAYHSRDHYNGEYHLAVATQLNKPYWIKSSQTCPSNTYYVMQVQDSYGLWWMIGDTLQPTYIDGQPYCERPTPTNPILCTAGWHYWYSASNYGLLSLTVTDGLCPTLDCHKIKLSNTGHNACDKTFEKDMIKDNVFINGETYLYFNKQTFKWYCSNTLGIHDCGDDSFITHFYVSSNDDQWFDINVGQTAQWQVHNGNTAQFQCVGSTSSPTENPPNFPIISPTEYTTMFPTENPIQNPTISPTQNPTKFPTLFPTKYPTNAPSLIPTSNPTTIPTCNPTQNPTKYPTQNPTFMPSVSPMKFSTFYPSKIPTQTPINEHSVYDMNTTLLFENTGLAADISQKQNVFENVSDLYIVYAVMVGIILMVSTCTICLLVMYCRIKTKEANTNDTNVVPPKIVTSMSKQNSINLCEFTTASTPNLTALNATMGDMKGMDLNTNVLDLHKVGSVSTVISKNEAFDLEFEEEGIDDLYTIDFHRQDTKGNDLCNDNGIITKGNIESVTVGM